jgi:hypothetical protein
MVSVPDSGQAGQPLEETPDWEEISRIAEVYGNEILG